MSIRNCTPVSGLSQALALSVATMDTTRRVAQASTVYKSVGPLIPGPADPIPLTVEPHPEAGSWGRNMERFLSLLNSTAHSKNPYNDHRFFAHAPVLNSGWMEVPPGFKYQVAPGRAGVQCGALGPENNALITRFEKLLAIADFDKRYPVLFDRDGLILDGLHRLRACAKADCQFYFLRLDF